MALQRAGTAVSAGAAGAGASAGAGGVGGHAMHPRMDDDTAIRLLWEATRPGKFEGLQDGMFKLLLEPVEFMRRVYPGQDVSKLDRSAPRSLQDLLSDRKHRASVKSLLPLAHDSATSVLEGVKRRARAENEVMDAETEEALWPVVFREAFARQVGTLAERVARQAHAQQVCVCASQITTMEQDSWPHAFICSSTRLLEFWSVTISDYYCCCCCCCCGCGCDCDRYFYRNR